MHQAVRGLLQSSNLVQRVTLSFGELKVALLNIRLEKSLSLLQAATTPRSTGSWLPAPPRCLNTLVSAIRDLGNEKSLDLAETSGHEAVLLLFNSATLADLPLLNGLGAYNSFSFGQLTIHLALGHVILLFFSLVHGR